MTEENKNERYIDKEIIQQEEISNTDRAKENKSSKKKPLIIISVIIVLLIGVSAVFIFNGSDKDSYQNQIIPPNNENVEDSINTNLENTNIPTTNISVNEEVVLSGRVFIKAYGTPSESYGIISTDGNEIGFGAYDSMREQFRPYVNDNVTVTFENICKSTTYNCCKSVFYYCGTVSSWEPIEEDK